MAELFLKVFNMSVSAGWLVLAVLAARLFLKKAPRWIHVLLWGIVAVRLICPISIESAMSLMPSAEVVSPDIGIQAVPQIQTGIPAVNEAINPIISQTLAPKPERFEISHEIWVQAFGILWMAGVAVMALYGVFSGLRLRGKLREAVVLEDRIYLSEKTASPFILGIFRPNVYLPYGMDSTTQSHVIAHELAHIRRKDHWWKPLGFFLLCLHWFNPLVWLAYILLCRDIEMACDEKVIREMGNQERADYSQALLRCSIRRSNISACPLAFGEVGVKQRIRSVLRYKKPGFWIILTALILCAVVAVCFLTDPRRETDAYDGYMLSVRIQDGSSVKEGEPRWNYFVISPFSKVTLPGANSVGLSLKKIRDDGVHLVFDKPLLLEGESKSDLWLKRGEQIELVTPTPGGSTWYSFSIVDKSFLFSDYTPLESLPEDYSLDQAKSDGCVVMEDGDVSSGKEVWWNFYQRVQSGIPAGVRYATYFTLKDPSRYSSEYYETYKNTYPRLYVHDLSYDGEVFHVRWYEDGELIQRTYQYLLRFQGEAETEWAQYESYVRYVLTNKVVSDWWEIMMSTYSSQMGVAIDHMSTYVNLIYPGEPTLGDLTQAQTELEPYMKEYRIATIGVNEINWTLDIEVYEPIAGLEELVAGVIEPAYVRIYQLEGDLRFTRTGENARLMTMEDVLNLSTKKMELNWEDLLPFLGKDIGSGLYVIRYDIDSDYYLLVGDGKTEGNPMYANLCHRDGSWIDIRAGDVKRFLLERKEADLGRDMQSLIDEICSSPLHMSAPGAYIDEHPQAYEKLLSCGEDTLRWCFVRFLEGEQTGLPGHIMAIACEEIMLGWGEAYLIEEINRMTGQDWFDEFFSLAKDLERQYSQEQLRDAYPGAWIALSAAK